MGNPNIILKRVFDLLSSPYKSTTDIDLLPENEYGVYQGYALTKGSTDRKFHTHKLLILLP